MAIESISGYNRPSTSFNPSDVDQIASKKQQRDEGTAAVASNGVNGSPSAFGWGV
jgi:hypothetical protein